MAIDNLPSPPQSTDPANFSTNADTFLAALPLFATQANALAAAMNLNSTTDASTSSLLIATGAKTFAASVGKSFQPGMYLVAADAAAPSTNSMFGQITSYDVATGALVLNVMTVRGSGTKAAWVISQSSAGGAVAGPLATSGITGAAASGANNDITSLTALTAGGLPNSSVLAANIADGAITAAKLDSGQTGAMPVAGIRAAVTFAVSGGVCTIQHAINVSSVTYLSTGWFRVNFTTAMGSTNFGMVATCMPLGGASSQALVADYGGSSARNTAYCDIYTTTGWADGLVAAAVKDSPLVTALFMG